MWTIFETKLAAKNIEKLPHHIQEKYELWRSIIYVSGPDGVRRFPGFKDHALKGEWQGYRSSSVNSAYRVIYRIEQRQISIYVVDVNHHDYKRK